MSKSIFRLTLVATLVLAPALFIAACGSSDDDETTVQESTADGSSHRSGEDCGSCHDTMSADKKFTFSGTVYTTHTSTNTVAGAKVKIYDNVDNTLIEIISDKNGNFFTGRGDPTSGWYAELSEAMVMITTNGSCNASGCHDSDLRVY